MHELSLAKSLIDLVEEKVRECGGKRATKVYLIVGALSSIHPSLLRSAFEFLKKGTLADDAELEIREIPAKLRCRRCGSEFTSYEFDLTCPNCGGWGGEVISGEELILERIELEVE